MPQIFHHSTNALAKLTIYGAVFILVALLWMTAELNRSSWNTGQWVERQQPVQFSHKHHVGDDGLDCRYCHTTVETAATAGLPATETCMSCHKQIWAESTYLEPVRASFRDNKPIEWIRVHDLPDYAYCDHSNHVKKEIDCSACHGRVDEMPIAYRLQHCRWSGAWNVTASRKGSCAIARRFLTWRGGPRTRRVKSWMRVSHW